MKDNNNEGVVRKELNPTIVPEVMPQDIIGMIKLSEILFKSGMFPEAKSPAGVLCIIEFGRELGIPPVVALNNISNVKGRLFLSAHLMLGIALNKGIRYTVDRNDEHSCEIRWYKDRLCVVSSFTIEEAKQAGLVKEGSGWKNYPKDMLWARAVARGIRKVDPLLLPVQVGVIDMVEPDTYTETNVLETELIEPEANEPESNKPEANEPEIKEPRVNGTKERGLTLEDFHRFWGRMKSLGHNSDSIHKRIKDKYNFNSVKEYIATGKTLEDLEREVTTAEPTTLW